MALSAWAARAPRQLTTALWAAAALALGGLIASLPLEHSLLVLCGAALAAVSVWEPALGLALAMTLGPTKAFLAVARPGLPADLGQLFFALAVAGWLARGLARRSLVIPHIGLLLPLGLYSAVALFSLIPAASLEEGLKEALKWLEIALAMVILISEAERGRVNWIIAGILIAGLGQALVGIWQFDFRPNGPEPFRILGDRFRAYGSFEQPNVYGGFLGLIWPVAAGLALGTVSTLRGHASRAESRGSTLLASRAYRLVPTAFFALIAFVCLAGLYFSFSRGAWIGAAAAALAMTIALPRRLTFGIGLVAAALVAGWGLARAGLLPAGLTSRLSDVAASTTVRDVRGANINAANFAVLDRLAHWQAAVRMAEAHPWLGVGIGNYAAAYEQFRLFNWPNALGHAHMIYLNVLAETGILGLAAYLALWLAVIALTMRALAHARTGGVQRGLALGLLGAWVHLSAHQVFDNLYVNNVHFVLAGLLALLVYLSRLEK